MVHVSAIYPAVPTGALQKAQDPIPAYVLSRPVTLSYFLPRNSLKKMYRSITLHAAKATIQASTQTAVRNTFAQSGRKRHHKVPSLC